MTLSQTGINPTAPPYNAAFDGVTDDTSAMVSADAAAASAGVPLQMPPGTTLLGPITFTSPRVVGNNTTIKLKRQSYSAYTAMVTIQGDFNGFIIDCDDPVFLQGFPLFASHASGLTIGPNVEIKGQFLQAIRFIDCQYCKFLFPRVISTAYSGYGVVLHSDGSAPSMGNVLIGASVTSTSAGAFSGQLIYDDVGTQNLHVGHYMEIVGTPAVFTGSLSPASGSASTLTVTAVSSGAILNGMAITGPGVANPTLIAAFGSGSGGVGTYIVSGVQTSSPVTIVGSLPGAFGFCINNGTQVMCIGGQARNTFGEGFQISSSTDCRISDASAQWDDMHGTDFGFSMDGCTNCSMSGTVVNSYKTGAASAADGGNAFGQLFHDVIGHNCAVRENLNAGSSQAFEANGESYSNSSYEFRNCRNFLDAGQILNYVFVETAGAGGAISNGIVKSVNGLGPGTYNDGYSMVAGSGTLVWMDEFQDWTPTVTSTGGGSVSISSSNCQYKQSGSEIFFVIDLVIGTDTGSGSLLVSLPPIPASAPPYGQASGRENVATGAQLQGLISTTLVEIFTYNNGYPGGNGHEIMLSGSYLTT